MISSAVCLGRYRQLGEQIVSIVVPFDVVDRQREGKGQPKRMDLTEHVIFRGCSGGRRSNRAEMDVADLLVQSFVVGIDVKGRQLVGGRRKAADKKVDEGY